MSSLLSLLLQSHRNPVYVPRNTPLIPSDDDPKFQISKEASWQRPHPYHDFKGYCIDFVISCNFFVLDWLVNHDDVNVHQMHSPMTFPRRPMKIHHHVLKHPHRNRRTTIRELKGICKAIESQLKLIKHPWPIPEPYSPKSIVLAAKEALDIIYSSSQSQMHDSFTIKADLRRMFYRFIPVQVPRMMVPATDESIMMVPATDESIMKLEHKVISKSDSTEKECAICLDELPAGCEAVSMPCLHVFHGNCIVPWLQTSHYCPLCRFKMPTD